MPAFTCEHEILDLQISMNNLHRVEIIHSACQIGQLWQLKNTAFWRFKDETNVAQQRKICCIMIAACTKATATDAVSRFMLGGQGCLYNYTL